MYRKLRKLFFPSSLVLDSHPLI
uniref:Uncharacterized protein n=1 Tax=Anguilla anguilla TaxID=7936 RepID=A0A0E9S7R2_ANGAN